MSTKLSLNFKFPCNFNSNSPQAKEHRRATIESDPQLFGIMKIYVHVDQTGDARIFKNLEKHYTGVINQRVSGGKWEEVKDSRYQSKETWLLAMINEAGARPATYEGGPRLSLRAKK